MPNGGSVPSIKARLLTVSLTLLVLDQWSKWMVEEFLSRHTPKTIVPGFMDLAYVRNTGVAFGLFPADGRLSVTVILTLLGIVALGVVLFYYWKTPPENRLLLVALTLILGGAIGNLIDRVMAGSVTDFIDVYVGTYHWPTFNLADSGISVGIALMVLDTLRPPRRDSAARRPVEEESLPGDAAS